MWAAVEPQRTLAQRKTEDKLTADESDRLDRVTRVLALGQQVLGTRRSSAAGSTLPIAPWEASLLSSYSKPTGASGPWKRSSFASSMGCTGEALANRQRKHVATALSGMGSMFGGGRRHHQGTLIEYLVHVDPLLAPSNLRLLEVSAP